MKGRGPKFSKHSEETKEEGFDLSVFPEGVADLILQYLEKTIPELELERALENNQIKDIMRRMSGVDPNSINTREQNERWIQDYFDNANEIQKRIRRKLLWQERERREREREERNKSSSSSSSSSKDDKSKDDEEKEGGI